MNEDTMLAVVLTVRQIEVVRGVLIAALAAEGELSDDGKLAAAQTLYHTGVALTRAAEQERERELWWCTAAECATLPMHAKHEHSLAVARSAVSTDGGAKRPTLAERQQAEREQS